MIKAHPTPVMSWVCPDESRFWLERAPRDDFKLFFFLSSPFLLKLFRCHPEIEGLTWSKGCEIENLTPNCLLREALRSTRPRRTFASST